MINCARCCGRSKFRGHSLNDELGTINEKDFDYLSFLVHHSSFRISYPQSRTPHSVTRSLSWLLSLNPLIGLAVAIGPLALLAHGLAEFIRAGRCCSGCSCRWWLSLVLMWTELWDNDRASVRRGDLWVRLIDGWQLPKRGVFTFTAKRSAPSRYANPTRAVDCREPGQAAVCCGNPATRFRPSSKQRRQSFACDSIRPQSATMDYELLASRRGALQLEKTTSAVRSPLSLWHRDLEYDCVTRCIFILT